MTSSKKHTPDQRAILEAAELQGLLTKTRGPNVTQSKEAYIDAWKQARANPSDRPSAIAADKALRHLRGQLDAVGVCGGRAKRLLFRHWESEALNAAPDMPIAETPSAECERGGWARRCNRHAVQSLEEVVSGWGK